MVTGAWCFGAYTGARTTMVRIIIGRSRTEKTDTLAREPMDLAKFNGNIYVR
jgi:hypothetical protein